MIKVIKTYAEYLKALDGIEKLMTKNPSAGTADAHKLELLSLLVKDYESKKIPTERPDPVEAILFRMEQERLSPRDLIPYIGSRSKISEILSRKRPLTLSMIRALHDGLGIPLKSLIQTEKTENIENGSIDLSKFPIKEMIKRHWVDYKLSDIPGKAEKIIEKFLEPLGTAESVFAMYRTTRSIRSARSIDIYSLMMWNARIMLLAKKNFKNRKYTPGTVSSTFMKKVANLSISKDGPRTAAEFLKNHGIPLVIEPPLPRTHLDGAVIMPAEGPLIGLTIRYDRLDNFWFCLIHELAHIALNHLTQDTRYIYDDLDADSSNDQREKQADDLASEVLIPENAWENSLAKDLNTPEAAKRLAKKLNIHPSIVAGKMRYIEKSYRILNNVVGHHKVRSCFKEIKWS